MTALPISKPVPFYSPDGSFYHSIPHDLADESRYLRFLGLINLYLREGKPRQLTDPFLAKEARCSISTVRRYLDRLEAKGMIVRRWDEVLNCRTIQRLFSIRGSRANAPKSKKAKEKGSKIFTTPLSKNGRDSCSNPTSAPSLLEGEQEKKTAASAADVGRESPSSSAAGEPEQSEAPKSAEEAEALKAAALAALKAQVAESQSASPPPSSPPPAPSPKRDKPPRGPELTDDKLAEMAAAGDRAAQAELNERHRAARDRAARLRAAEEAASSGPKPVFFGVDLASEPDRTVEWTWIPETGEVVLHEEPAAGGAARADPEPPPVAEVDPRPPDREVVVTRPPPSTDRPKRGFLGRLFGRG